MYALNEFSDTVSDYMLMICLISGLRSKRITTEHFW